MALIDDSQDPTAAPAGAAPMPGATPAAPAAPDAGAAPAGAGGGSSQADEANAAISSSETKDASGGVDIDPAAVRAKMNLPPQFKDAYDRVVLAGTKLLFNQQTHQMIMSHLEGQGPIGPRLGRGIAGLMLMIFRKSQYQAPAQVLIPAGVDLLVQAVDYISKTKVAKLTADDVALATKILVATLLRQFGGSPDKIKAQIGVTGNPDDNGDGDAAPDDGDGPDAEDAPDAADDAGAGAPPQPGAAPAGLVNGQQEQ